ncbi:MAG: hypothetical protein OEU36_02495 [Gammaproteobacteria bacterium]|nr:hypothetical protein [Gammaproteobacteria bacterium]
MYRGDLTNSAEDVLEKLYKLDVDGTRNVAEAAAAAGVGRFIFVSSVSACSDRR